MSAPGTAVARVLPHADQLDVTRLFALFAHVFDNAAVDDLGLVFTPDAVIELTRGTGRTLTGLDEISSFVLSLGPHPPDHHTLDTIFAVGPDGTEGIVRARSRYLAVLPDGSTHNGDFLDELVRTPDGWRIARRISVPRNPLGAAVPLPAGFLDAWRP